MCFGSKKSNPAPAPTPAPPPPTVPDRPVEPLKPNTTQSAKNDTAPATAKTTSGDTGLNIPTV